MVEFSPRVNEMHDSALVVRQLFSSFGDNSIISFAGGSPAREVIPVDFVHQISVDVLGRNARGIEALSYGQILGVKDLRQVIVEQLLRPYGVMTDADHVLVTVGGLEAINMVCQLYIAPGDVILVESPTFFHAMATFSMHGAHCIGVAMDEDGLNLADLEEKLKHSHAKILYTIPTFQNPTGKTIPAAKRRKIAELAAEYDVMVLEDDPYRELRYSGEDLPPIRAFDPDGHVIYASSFSKNFSAGCRLGYVTASDAVMDKLQDIKCASNSHSPNVTQILCAEFFKRGYYPEYRKFFCDLQRERRDHMMDAIDRYFPAGTKHTVPDGGLFTWVELPPEIDTRLLRSEAVSRADIKVTFTPGETFFPKESAVKNCMRMSFCCVQPEMIQIGVQKLAKLIQEKL